MPVDVPLDVTELNNYLLIGDGDTPDPVPVRNPRTDTITQVPKATLIGPPAVVIPASPDLTTKLGSASAASPGYLAGIRGYPVAGGPTGYQWMIAPLITAATGAAFEAIPGDNPSGWVNMAARQVFVDRGLVLINPPHSIPASAVVDAWGDLYDAAELEVVTRYLAGYPISALLVAEADRAAEPPPQPAPE